MLGPTDLELSIFRTICWFSVFEIPLTRFEIWKWLLAPARPYALLEVDQVLQESSWLSHRIQEQQGVVCLKSASFLAQHQQRHRRFLDATRKFRKLRRACTFFSSLPAVQSVAAVNSLAWWHTTPKSDIDLFIVTRPKHIWSSRFFLVFPFLLSGNRPNHSTEGEVNDPFCFSFLCTHESLQLEALKWNTQDYYLAYWIKSMVPMFDRGQVMEQLFRLNKWADSILPNAHLRHVHPLHQSVRMMYLPIQWSLFESFFRWIQRSRFPLILRELANKDTRVVIRDDMLKFHEQDRRQEFMQRFEDVYQQYI